jgi:hypothetical protein
MYKIFGIPLFFVLELISRSIPLLAYFKSRDKKRLLKSLALNANNLNLIDVSEDFLSRSMLTRIRNAEVNFYHVVDSAFSLADPATVFEIEKPEVRTLSNDFVNSLLHYNFVQGYGKTKYIIPYNIFEERKRSYLDSNEWYDLAVKNLTYTDLVLFYYYTGKSSVFLQVKK